MPRYNADMNEAVTAAADVLADTLCLCMALRLMDKRVRPRRVAAAAVLGAGIACAARRFGESGPKAALIWLPTALLMARVACGRGRTALRGALLLLAAEGLLGGTVLGAFFMATDYVTSPVPAWGRVIYGVGIGVINFAIRTWGAYPEGVTYAILLMNIATPLIERVTRPRKYGEVKRHA